MGENELKSHPQSFLSQPALAICRPVWTLYHKQSYRVNSCRCPQPSSVHLSLGTSVNLTDISPHNAHLLLLKSDFLLHCLLPSFLSLSHDTLFLGVIFTFPHHAFESTLRRPFGYPASISLVTTISHGQSFRAKQEQVVRS